MEGGYQKMSDTIENQIVSLQFDNKHFEKNTKTSIKTLEKLREKLNFKGATKGLQNIEDASNKVTMSRLSESLDTIKNKFSALEIMGTTALINLTNSAVNYGKKIVSALTIDPVKTGFEEYQTKMGSIQTIMSNTASKGKTLEDVTKTLNELNTYADKTIYNFAEMTRNIGTFTAAGVELEVAASAIQGIANIAAASGSTSQQASVAMYQLSQAIAAGTVRLMDWNSVVNAGMGGEKFQLALIATAREMARTTKSYTFNVDECIRANGSFRESLSEGWLTADVLTTTLEKFTVEGAKKYGEKMMELGEWTQESADALVKMATDMEGAATKVKTFTQLWDTLKEAAQSGWAQTWEIIVGDFDQAISFLTKISDIVGGIIGDAANNRNKFLGVAINPIGLFSDTIKNLGLDLEDFQEKIKETSKKNGIAIDELIEKRGNLSNAISAGDIPEKVFLETLQSYTDEQLKSLNFTEEQIEKYKEFTKDAEVAGTEANKLMSALSVASGRSLLIDSLGKSFSYLKDVLNAIKKAWSDIFKPIEESQIYRLIKRINDFTSGLKLSEETADKITRTFKGMFAVVDALTTIFGGGFKFAFKAITKFLGIANVDILSLTASIGDALVKFRDWLDSVIDFEGIFNKIAPYIEKVAQAIHNWTEGLKTADNIPKYIIEGFLKGFKWGIGKVLETVTNFAKNIITTVKDVLRIDSPSKEFFEIGEFTLLGFLDGLKAIAGAIWNFIKLIFNKCIEIVQQVDLGKLMTLGITAGTLAVLNSMTKIIGTIFKPFEYVGKGISRVGAGIEAIGNGLESLTKSLRSRLRAESIKQLAISIGILAASVVALTLVDQTKLQSAITSLVVLAGVIVALSIVTTEMAKADNLLGEGKIFKVSTSLVAIAASLLLVSIAIKKLSTIDQTGTIDAIILLGVCIASLGALMWAVSKFVRTSDTKDVVRLGFMLVTLSVALKFMVGVIKAASGVDAYALLRGFAVLSVIELLFAAIISISHLYSYYSKGISRTLLGLSAALLLMVGVIKVASRLDARSLIKGLLVVSSLELIILGLIGIISLYDAKADKVGSVLLKISMSMLAMLLVIKMASGISADVLLKGSLVIAGFAVIVAGLVGITHLASDKELKRVSRTILALSVSIGMLALIAAVVGMLDVKQVAKGTAAIAVLSGMMAIMLKSLEGVGNIKKNLISIGVIMGLLVGVLAALTFIDTDTLIKTSASLVLVLMSFAVVMKVLGSIEKISWGAIGAFATVVAVAAGLLALMKVVEMIPSPDPSIETVASLSLLLLSLSACVVMLGQLGPATKYAFIGIGALVVLIAAMTGVIYGLWAIFQDIEDVEKRFDLGIKILEKVGYGIGAFIGNLAAGLASGYLSIIPEIGNALTAFMENVSGFIEGLKKVDSNILEKAGVLAASILAITGTEIIAIVGNFGPGGALVNFASMGAALSLFMINADSFIKGISSLNPYKMAGAKDLATAILTLTTAQLVDSINILSGLTIDKFSKNIVDFGDAIKQFSEKISGKIDIGAVEAATNAGNMMIALASALPNTGGLWDEIAGTKDLGKFSENLTDFGTALCDFSDTITNRGINQNSVDAAKAAGSVMVEFANTIPKTGGMVDLVTGFSDLKTFGNNLYSFGEALVDFSEIISEDGALDNKAIEAAKYAGGLMTELANTVPKTGGLQAALTGFNDLKTFGSDLCIFGFALRAFASIMKDAPITEATMKAVSYAGGMLVDLANTIPKTGGIKSWFDGSDSLSRFGSELASFGYSFTVFANNIKNVETDKLALVADTFNQLSDVANGLEYASNLGTALKNLNSNNINEFINTVSESSSDLTKVGENLMTSFDIGIKAGMTTVGMNFRGNMKLLIAETQANGKKFFETGAYLAKKFAEGVDSILTAGSEVYETLKLTFSRLFDDLLNDVDTQPVIRPVLDLTNVRSGTESINSMLRNGSFNDPLFDIGNMNYVSSHQVRLINDSVGQRIQNGYDELVDAINGLRDDIDSIGNTTYSIGNITYDDSAISDAIETIVRALRLDRRV